MSSSEQGLPPPPRSPPKGKIAIVRQRRACRQPMPPDDMLRNSIARNLTQILVNMVNKDCQQRCREILQVDVLAQGAHHRILAALEEIDAEREHRQRLAQARQLCKEQRLAEQNK